MTKHSDYFVWKNTSERVARRCDYTIDKMRENSCVLKHLFLKGVEQLKMSKPQKGTLRRAINVTFSKFRGWRRENKNRAPRGFLKPRSAQF